MRLVDRLACEAFSFIIAKKHLEMSTTTTTTRSSIKILILIFFKVISSREGENFINHIRSNFWGGPKNEEWKIQIKLIFLQLASFQFIQNLSFYWGKVAAPAVFELFWQLEIMVRWICIQVFSWGNNKEKNQKRRPLHYLQVIQQQSILAWLWQLLSLLEFGIVAKLFFPF